jgi:Raf kinase inhibitor-like YbhB/YbcL family protein
VVLLVGLTAACGTSGRGMQAPAPGATAPPRKPDVTTTTVAGANTSVIGPLLALTSAAFPPGGDVPGTYTCDGAGGPPPLNWANIPDGTVELAVVVIDPDAGEYLHWLVAGIPVAPTSLDLASMTPAEVVLANSAGTKGYAPLCPPAGETHTYDFTLYALSAPSGLTAASDPTQALTKLATTATATAVLTGSYARSTAN